MKMKGTPSTRCPLCAQPFTPGEGPCRGCLFSKGCDLLCCPHCGYSYRERSALLELFKSLWRKVKQ
ncbi:MAG: hypothetical protein N3G78_03185 [Desulfobacterota bacterium]|nr:hypothetical protein [Thermodesulfobacteriota bacterium]